MTHTTGREGVWEPYSAVAALGAGLGNPKHLKVLLDLIRASQVMNLVGACALAWGSLVLRAPLEVLGALNAV